jgi:hypothetical protein
VLAVDVDHFSVCCRLTRSLEEVHRTLAMQEFRRRREKLALDNVRLGKVVSSRAVSAHCMLFVAEELLLSPGVLVGSLL